MQQATLPDQVDESNKRALISKAGVHHRNFRTRLRSLARDFQGNLSDKPPLLYSNMRSVFEHWTEFVAQSSTSDFKVTLFSKV